MRTAATKGKKDDDQPQTFDEIVTTLDTKMFSQVNPEIPHIQRDTTLKANTRRSYADLATNYKAMKDLYSNPGPAGGNYFAQVQQLKDNHLRLVESVRNDLKLEVPPQLMALLQRRAAPAQQPTMVADLVPFQRRVFIRPPGIRPGLRPPGAIGPPSARNQIGDARQRMHEAQDRMRDLRTRARGGMQGNGP